MSIIDKQSAKVTPLNLANIQDKRAPPKQLKPVLSPRPPASWKDGNGTPESRVGQVRQKLE